jgi:hypothetical protein
MYEQKTTKGGLNFKLDWSFYAKDCNCRSVVVSFFESEFNMINGVHYEIDSSTSYTMIRILKNVKSFKSGMWFDAHANPGNNEVSLLEDKG